MDGCHPLINLDQKFLFEVSFYSFLFQEKTGRNKETAGASFATAAGATTTTNFATTPTTECWTTGIIPL